MNKIALLTPWPPQHSGIADYAFDLATVLSGQGAELVVYTTEPNPRSLNGTKIISVEYSTDFSDLEKFDCLIYQLGNNTDFHLWMVPLLHMYPGVVHLHDLVMHHMAAWLTWLQGEPKAYLSLMHKWYGPQGLRAGEAALASGNYLWDSDIVAKYPLSEEYLQDASGIIVHSQYALEHIRTTTPHVPSFQVPQLYHLQPREVCASSLHTIVVMGGVDPQKRLDWVIAALKALRDRLPAGHVLRLRVAGSIDPRCLHLREEAAGVTSETLQIEFLGRVDENQFDRLLQESDLCIALRYPTMGETSAIVSKAMQYGLPTVVNDIGWYSELPGNIVKKLPIENCQQKLGALLEYLVLDSHAFAEWSSRCYNYARQQFSLESYGHHYLGLCNNPRGEELVSDILSCALRECGMTGADEEDILLSKIVEEAYF